jgi:predicted acylesterase/phospholipase RssA
MRAYVLPISGGYMPAQVQLLITLSRAGFTPDIAFGCSGGNVAAYIGLASEWDPDTMQEMMKQLSKSIKFKSKPRLSSITVALGLVSSEDGMYEETGVEEFFGKYITPQSNSNTEIWTGTYNKLSNKSVFFSNKSKADSLLQVDIDQRISCCEEPVYLNGDVTSLFLVSRASATIPMLLPDVYISQEAHIDGGMNWSTPAVPLLENSDSILHIVHICGNNTDVPDVKSRNTNFVSETFKLFSIMSNGHIIQERYTLLQQLKSRAKEHNLTIGREYVQNASLSELIHLRERSESSMASVMFIHPFYNRCTRLYDVDYQSIERVMRLTEQYFTIELFYLH